jgi:oligoribonuclease
MAQDPNNLIWIDLEMSGLDPEVERILEVAMVVTDSSLNVLAESPVLVVHQEPELMSRMDDWNKSVHAKSGLIGRVAASNLTEQHVENQMLDFLAPYVPAKTSPMCGNSVHQDRRFLVRYMPRLESFFLYRNLDVSTLKELARRWRPEVLAGFNKEGRHEALADIYDSIAELKHYREHFLKV